MELAVALRGVSKKYVMYKSGHQRLVEALHPFRKKSHEEFWALRDISIEIPQGETVGILGVNGSGKSTLLQLICSIMEPTTGQVAVKGRVAALLELGAGFNPNLTGRENAEMNCSILGMTAAQIHDAMPLIESFADIDAFFDQPVRTYSSGMFMRVAFSAAIHTDPDILVIDEALAVGDARFQQKCFERFRDFQQAGKTILLVTHDRFTIPRLCTRALILDKGRLLLSGDPRVIVDHYSQLLTQGDAPSAPAADAFPETSASVDPLPAAALDNVSNEAAPSALAAFLADHSGTDRCASNPTYNRNEKRYGVGGARVIDYLLLDGARVNPVELDMGGEADLYVKVLFEQPVEAPILGLSVKLYDGTQVFGVHTGWLGSGLGARAAGEIACFRVHWHVDLAAQDWFIELAVARSDSEVLETRDNMIHLRVLSPTRTTGLAWLKTRVEEISLGAGDADVRA